MSTDMKSFIRWLIGMMLVGVIAAASEPARSPAPAASSNEAARSALSEDAKAAREEAPIANAAKDIAARSDLRPAAVLKDVFKDFRPGACRMSAQSAPVSSWPARGDAAISFCRP